MGTAAPPTTASRRAERIEPRPIAAVFAELDARLTTAAAGWGQVPVLDVSIPVAGLAAWRFLSTGYP
jgi:hypothetical protein